MSLPVLSAYDPTTNAEGALNPLGLFSIADALGVRLAPGVRERQSHPRFLTTMAVSANVCAGFDEDRVAADGISPPWLVFEWLAVEGFVRSAGQSSDYVGLPGSMKMEACKASDTHLSAARYLKTPRVFGFNGVYRLLARTLDVLDDRDRLGATGYELLRVWEKEQGLEGFVSTGGGPGVDARSMLVQAVNESLDRGVVSRTGGWGGWSFFGEHLGHNRVPREEARFLWNLLTAKETASATRAEVLGFLAAPSGGAAWQESERDFHHFIIANASQDLTALLRAIDAYERFSRLLDDAFESCLHSMTRKAGRTTLQELAAPKPVRRAAERVPALYGETADLLEQFGLAGSFDMAFGWTARKLQPEEWVARLLEHHREVQRKKPPHGKNPWCETLPDGSFMVRSAYRRPDPPAETEEYVHAYRTNPLWSFAIDLGKAGGARNGG